MKRCEYFVERKKRQCYMQPRKGRRFCLEHLAHEEGDGSSCRVPCPLDPNHTVWQRELTRHMAKCNARPKKQPLWFCRGCNSGDGEEGETEAGEGEADDSLIEMLRGLGYPELDMEKREHCGLDAWVAEKENTKHVEQLSSLVGGLKNGGLLSTNCVYMEFGCGKAELSRSINLANIKDYSDSSHYGFGLVDRGVNRLKNDSKILKDNDGKFDIKIKRDRIDIEHLLIQEFLCDMDALEFVAVSKHLCGVATDLTLRSIIAAAGAAGVSEASDGQTVTDRAVSAAGASSLTNSDSSASTGPISSAILGGTPGAKDIDANGAIHSGPNSSIGATEGATGEQNTANGEGPETNTDFGAAAGETTGETDGAVARCARSRARFGGLLVAMCCRHACRWKHLLPESRQFLRQFGISGPKSFAGLRRVASWAVSGTRASDGSSCGPEREFLGLAARRLIDESRAHAAKVAFPTRTVRLFNYVPSSVTRENVALLIGPPPST